MRTILAILLGMSLLVAAAPTSHAQGKKKKGAAPAPATASSDEAKRPKKARVFDFGAMSFEGTMRTPQLLYFLGRVKQELDRASLEKRSFMPELVRSVDEGGL
jgi:hypothetical protein